MIFNKPVPLTEIAALVGASIVGDANVFANGINEIHKVQTGDLVFVDHPKYYQKCLQSAASFIIINKEIPSAGKTLLVTEQPFEAYLKIVNHFRPFAPSLQAQSASAKVAATAVVMPNVYIGNHVSIGERSVIYPNVTILDYCTIGADVIIQSGTVVGSDAFYYNKKTDRDAHYKKMLSCGDVIIEDNVEIGAQCTIDRGVTGSTVIGMGSKLDNMVHIGHDSVIGKNCLFAAQVAIAGAVHIEDNVVLWGQVGVNKSLRIGKDAVVFAQSGIKGDLSGGATYFGSPAIDALAKMKEQVWIRRIAEMWEVVMQKNLDRDKD